MENNIEFYIKFWSRKKLCLHTLIILIYNFEKSFYSVVGLYL